MTNRKSVQLYQKHRMTLQTTQNNIHEGEGRCDMKAVDNLTLVLAHAERPRSAITSFTFSRLWLCVVLLGSRSAAENSMFSRTVSIPITMSSCIRQHAHRVSKNVVSHHVFVTTSWNTERFRNSFTGQLSSRSPIKWLLQMPSHLKHFTTPSSEKNCPDCEHVNTDQTTHSDRCYT